MSSKKSGDIDAKLLEGDVRKGMFPAGIEPGQLIEIARALARLDSSSDVVELRKLFGGKTEEMERLINASLLLEFATIQNGLISITEHVKEVNSLPRNKKRQYLTERLSLLEPFRTALEVAGKSREFSSDEVADLLYKRELRWTEEEELNGLLVHAILLDWAIFSGLLQYDGRSEKFSLRS